MLSSSCTQWYLAQLRPNAHKIAKSHLAQQGIETFLPLEERTTRRAGRFHSALKPLFPGYIFVAFDAARHGWQAINATRGVTRLVSFGAAPAAVPAHLVTGLRARCDDQGKLAGPAPFAPGDQVRILTGPFAEFVAKVDEIAPDRRVWLLLDLMGRQSRIAAPPGTLSSA